MTAPETEPAGCRHCRQMLLACPACGGRFDTGRLCQECMFGRICPDCRRHWTWV